MQAADLLTLLTRFFSAIVLSLIAVAYARRRDLIPTFLFGFIAVWVWIMAFRLLRHLRTRPEGSTPDAAKRE